MAGNKGKRKVYEKQSLSYDHSTGELTKGNTEAIFVNRSSEKFVMHTTTSGLEWALPIRNHLLLLNYLGSLADMSTCVFSLSPQSREDIIKFFGWSSYKTLTAGLAELTKYDAIRRIKNRRNDFMLNPHMVYVGSTTDKLMKSNTYEQL